MKTWVVEYLTIDRTGKFAQTKTITADTLIMGDNQGEVEFWMKGEVSATGYFSDVISVTQLATE